MSAPVRFRQAPVQRRGVPLRTAMLSGRDVVKVGGTLEKILYGKTVPRTQNDRMYYGRNIDLDIVERAIRSAAQGNMISVTDLGRESVLAIDGHTAGVLNKRINRALAIDWNIVANSGNGRMNFDHGRARARADFVRGQILRIPQFRDRLADLSWSTWDNRASLEIGWEVGPGAWAGDPRLSNGWRARDLYWIHPRRLSFNQNRELVVLDEGTEGRNAEFRPRGFRLNEVPEKFVQSLPRLFNDYPEREGLLIRVMYWSFFQRLGTRERLSLMEVFGSPWRLVKSVDKKANQDAIDQSFETIKDMSSRSSAWLSPGVEADFIQPGPGSGQVHKDVIDDARSVISKFVLGGVATTDAVSTGLGSSIGDVQLSEEDLIIAGDLHQREAVIEHGLIDRIIELNYGPAELEYAPLFQFNIRGRDDREKATRVIKGSVDAGLDIALEEAYEVVGFRQPRRNEPVLRLVQSEGVMGIPEPPRSRVVYPPGQAPAPGDLAIEPAEAITPEAVPTEPGTVQGQPGGATPVLQPGQVPDPEATQAGGLELTPSDLASIVTVNEGRASVGKGPLLLPDGSRDPDGELTIAEFVKKKEAAAVVTGEAQGEEQTPVVEDPQADPEGDEEEPTPFASPSGLPARERDDTLFSARPGDPVFRLKVRAIGRTKVVTPDQATKAFTTHFIAARFPQYAVDLGTAQASKKRAAMKAKRNRNR